MGIKRTFMRTRRKLADIAEAAIGARILRPENGGFALEEFFLKRFFTYFQIDCVFDVGANTGQYAELLRSRVGFKGHIVSFEPIPELIEHLRRKAERDSNWHIEPVALSKTVGSAIFSVMVDRQFSSLLSPKHDECDKYTDLNKAARSVPVVTSTLKIEYLKYKDKLGFSRPFLKTDTQGNDVAVVDSAEETIDGFVGLQSELSVKRLYENAPNFHEAISFYQSRGFELSAIVPTHPWDFPSLVETDCIMFRAAALNSTTMD
jgi:FkbM family methyltransferase